MMLTGANIDSASCWARLSVESRLRSNHGLQARSCRIQAREVCRAAVWTHALGQRHLAKSVVEGT
jgi:hypothetical protein